MKKTLATAISGHQKALAELKKVEKDILSFCRWLKNTLKKGKKVLICGNGGSAADAQHFAAELVGRFKKNRTPQPAIALTTDTSTLTAIANDFGFEEVFKKQVEALAKRGDLLIALSTSGNSQNVIQAVSTAKKKGIKTVCLLGKDGGKLKNMADLPIVIKSDSTARIQEMHEFILHLGAEIAESSL